MNTSIETLRRWFDQHPKTKQWAWFYCALVWRIDHDTDCNLSDQIVDQDDVISAVTDLINKRINSDI